MNIHIYIYMSSTEHSIEIVGQNEKLAEGVVWEWTGMIQSHLHLCKGSQSHQQNRMRWVIEAQIVSAENYPQTMFAVPPSHCSHLAHVTCICEYLVHKYRIMCHVTCHASLLQIHTLATCCSWSVLLTEQTESSSCNSFIGGVKDSDPLIMYGMCWVSMFSVIITSERVVLCVILSTWTKNTCMYLPECECVRRGQTRIAFLDNSGVHIVITILPFVDDGSQAIIHIQTQIV